MCCLRHPQYRWGDPDESNLAPTIAPVVTRKGKQRMLHHPPIPQESRQPPLTSPLGAMPTPTRAAPRPRTRTRKQRDQGTPEPCSPLKRPPRRPRSSTDYRADAKEVPLDITQKRRPGLRAFVRVPKAQEVPTSQCGAMIPARFLQPWEVLEMGIHDMGASSEA